MSTKKDPHLKADPQPPAPSGDGALRARIAELEAAFTVVLDEAKTMKEIAARSQADLQNARDRMQRESRELAAFAVEGMLMKLLPTVDHFQRAFQHLPPDLGSHEWVKGVVTIEKELMRILEAAGLRRMSSLGQKADPLKHEVLQTGSGEQGTVTEVFEEGHELYGKVLRPAKVKVGDGSAPSVTQP